MRQYIFRSKLQFFMVVVALFCGNQVSADVVDCTPTRVRSMPAHMDTRCVGIDRWFVAQRSSTDAEHFNQMIALLNSSIVSGKPVKLYYSPTDSNPTSKGNLYGVELFR